MHPELYLKIHRQNERELERRLLRRYATESRSPGVPSRSRDLPVTDPRLHRTDHPHL